MNSPPVDHLSLAKITRKVLNRLAPFCYMQEATLDRVSSNPSIAKVTFPSSTPNSPEISPSPSISNLAGSTDEPKPTRATSSSSTVIPLSAHGQTRLVNKVKARVVKIVKAIDAHVHAAQVAFKMCREGMVLCDEDVRGVPGHPSEATTKEEEAGSSSKPELAHGGAAKESGKGDDDAWDVDIDPDEADDRGVAAPLDDRHKYGTSGHHFLLHFAHQGLELAKKTEESFKEVRQEAYKIAAQTKDRTITVLVPAAPGQPPTTRKQLKDVGTDLVASLTLLESDFGGRVKETVAWWSWVIADLEKGDQSTLCPLAPAAPTLESRSNSGRPSSSSSHGAAQVSEHYDKQALRQAYKWWEEAKEGWQAYYDAIATLHISYHGLLITSAQAWEGTTVVLKSRHNDSGSDHLHHSGPSLSRLQTKTGNGDGVNGEAKEYEMLVKQEVPAALEGDDAARVKQQDAAAKRRRGTGFLMWKAPYAEAPKVVKEKVVKFDGETERTKVTSSFWRKLTCR